MPERSSEWHPEVLPAAWLRAAEDLGRLSLLDDFYLAGGTGLALGYGHRRSADLDLFRETDFDGRDIGDKLQGASARSTPAAYHSPRVIVVSSSPVTGETCVGDPGCWRRLTR